MIADPLPLMVRYMEIDTHETLTNDEREILLFALYTESLRRRPVDGLAAKALGVIATKMAVEQKGTSDSEVVIGDDVPSGPPIFVFGSNEKGIHGGGAARVARERHGAILGQGIGPQGNSYAIPTCSKPTGEPNHEISLGQLHIYVLQFLKYAREHQELRFKVTQIGCGLAGWRAEQIAPLFADATRNCSFDSAWEPWLPGKTFWGTY